MNGSPTFQGGFVHLAAPRRQTRRAGPGGTFRPPTRVVIWLTGDIDMGSVGQVAEGLTRVCDRRHPEAVVLDLSRLSFMDGAGLSGLLTLRQRLAFRQQSLSLRNVPSLVTVLPNATGCRDVFDVIDGDCAFDDPA